MFAANCSRRRAFTLIELLVVVAIIALLISILLPSLGRAREQTKRVKCMSNLRVYGQGVHTYATENRDSLPGDLHPAIYRWQGIDALTNNPIKVFTPEQAKVEQERYLSYKLRRQFNDSDGSAKSVSDEVATCPTMISVNPDSNFISYKNITGRPAFPTHYVLNNVGAASPDDPGSGANDNPRITNPPFYFGYSSPNNSNVDQERQFPPQPLSKIRNASREWMIAEAWYRPSGGFVLSPAYQQEGPYQVNWTGESLPNFAPHFSSRRSYAFTDSSARDSDSAAIRDGKGDGETTTVFFDGHAAPVTSKTCFAGEFTILYGFEGTVNLADPRVPPVTGVVPYWK